MIQFLPEHFTFARRKAIKTRIQWCIGFRIAFSRMFPVCKRTSGWKCTCFLDYGQLPVAQYPPGTEGFQWSQGPSNHLDAATQFSLFADAWCVVFRGHERWIPEGKDDKTKAKGGWKVDSRIPRIMGSRIPYYSDAVLGGDRISLHGPRNHQSGCSPRLEVDPGTCRSKLPGFREFRRRNFWVGVNHRKTWYS